MASFLHLKTRQLATVAGLALAAAMILPAAVAQERIEWATDYRQACELAAQQRKLVLLHFYNDECPPCQRLEEHVFPQPQVAQAISRNYIPVKVHAGKDPNFATRYQVNRWPTDVVVSPAGQEVYRTASPPTPIEYITFVDQVALQAGVGASRQWATNMQQAGQQTAGQAAADAQAFAARMAGGAQNQANNLLNQAQTQVQANANRATGVFQGYGAAAQQQAEQAQQQLNQAGQQYQQAAQQAIGQASQTSQQFQQQVADNSRQINASGRQAVDAAQNLAGNLRSAWTPPTSQTTWQAGVTAGPPTAQGAQQQPAVTAPPQIAQQQPTPQTSVYQQPSFQQPIFQQSPQPQINPTISSASTAPTQGNILPASQAPPVALEGYCPVTLLETMKWKRADPNFGAIHRGRTYLFASGEEQAKFLAEPDRYSPALSGCDPVQFAHSGNLVEGKRSYGLTYRNQIFLFSSKEAIDQFERSPQHYAETIRQAMNPIPSQSETIYR